MYDVIIIGAGPAGAASAYYLAEAGKKVLLLERWQLPRFKPCGGGISERFIAKLPFDISDSVVGGTAKFQFLYQNEKPHEINAKIKIILVDRQRFDQIIVENAVKKGAELIDQVKVTDLEILEDKVVVQSDQGKFEAKYLIGADGANSFVAKKIRLNPKRGLISVLEAEVPGTNNIDENIIFNIYLNPGGYAWYFPKKQASSVGIAGWNQKQLLTDLRKWINYLGYEKETKLYAHPIPEIEPGAQLQKGRVLLVGDAAGLVDPITGEGIKHAITSAKIVSSAILDNKVNAYSKQIFDQISADFQYAYRLRWLYYRFPGFFYNLAEKFPMGFIAFAEVFCGIVNYKIVYRAVLRKVFYPFRSLIMRNI